MRAFTLDAYPVPLPPGHRFPMEKYALTLEACLQERIFDVDRLAPAPLAPDAVLLRAHTPAYVTAATTGALTAPEIRRIGFPWTPDLIRRCRASVGGTLAAAEAALVDGVAANLAGGTHHAFAGEGEGFCVFNDVACAALELLARGVVTRVAVVDLDVHQGNGTAAILGGHPQVFTLSLHGERNFPFRKMPSTLDVGLPDGCDDETYLGALDRALPPVMAFDPQLVLYIAGADPLRDDRLGRLNMSLEGLAERDRRVMTACRDLGAKVALSMGGGYARPIFPTVAAHVGTFRVAREVFG